MRPKEIGFLLLAVTAGAQTNLLPSKPARPIPAIEHVVIISIDGLRPDRLLLADTPVMHRMVAEGAYTFWAYTTAFATTLPSHTSMLTGVNPRKHGIEWNKDLPLKEMIYPADPTLFEMAHRAGYSTAMAAGKSKFNGLAKPGTLDRIYVSAKDDEADEPVCAEAVRMIMQFKPDVLFVHLPATDEIGHKFGWGSPEQLVAIAKADACVGRVLAALDGAALKASTAVIVTADHGGAGKTHGPDDPRSRQIPWIVTGPGVKPAYDLTQLADLRVNTEDTCATACYLLGLAQPAYFDGKPVLAAFQNPPPL